MKKTVSRRFEVTTTNTGIVWAEVGDVIVVSNRGGEHYNIKAVNDKPIFSRWMRKNWIEAHCK